MLKKLIVVSSAILLIVILPLLLLTAPFAQAQPDQKNDIPPQIVGGEEANLGDWLWQVALVSAGSTDFYDDYFCGGSLVEENWILTAAHCVEELSPDDFEVVVGVHNLANPETGYQKVSVQDVIFYPDYLSGEYDFDIALLLLSTAVVLGDTVGGTAVAPIPLVPADSDDLAGLQSTITGWGNTLAQPFPGGVNDPQTLQQTDIPILTNAACETAYDTNVGPGDWISPNMLCAGLEAGGQGACQGDGGGPLVIFDDILQQWQLAGVISWSVGCAAPGIPGVNTRVSEFTDWVHSYILQAEVSLEKSVSATEISPGETLAYTLTLKNSGAAPANSITLTDTIPLSTVYAVDSVTGGGIYVDDSLVWSDLSVAAGGETAVSFAVQVDTDAIPTKIAVFDDMENGADNWIVSHAEDSAPIDWTLDDVNPYRGDYAWFGEDVALVSDQYLVLPISDTLEIDSSLRFWHAYNLEEMVDGGVVEISTNNGVTWSDLGSAITHNGYNHFLEPSDNPLADRLAFTGASDGYVETAVDLSGYAGEIVQIRFRLGTNAGIAAQGWWIDDVFVGVFTAVDNIAYANGELSSNTTRTFINALPVEVDYPNFLPIVRKP